MNKIGKQQGEGGSIDDLPEEVVMDIIARLPPKSVVSFKLVCKQYKSLTESAIFCHLYRSNFNTSSSSNCSILHGGHNLSLERSSLELLKLDLPSSSSSSLGDSFFASVLAQEIRVVACADGLVLLRLKDKTTRCYYIGNPALPQWIQLPPHPSQETVFLRGFKDTGLVTHHYNNYGALSGYKVVRLHSEALEFPFSSTWSFEIFSSDTGEWSVRQVSCPGHGVSMLSISNPVSLNGKLHWLDRRGRSIIVHDFYGDHDELRVIPLPAPMQGTVPPPRYFSLTTPLAKMICTTSQGYFVLVDVGLVMMKKQQEVDNKSYCYNVRVWRLKSSWEKAWEINMGSVGMIPRNCVPVAVDCFDIHIMYLWDVDLKCFLAFNLVANTISCGTRKDGIYEENYFLFRDPMAVDVVIYKEDKFCSEQYHCIFHFVPSLQLVPRMIFSFSRFFFSYFHLPKHDTWT